MRPRKYYTISRDNLESVMEDVEQLINFFVIEFQRIIFAENVYATVAAFLSAFIGYFLVKFVPTWGLALIATTVVYFAPLVYIKNRQFIDEHLNQAGEIINQQATQVRDIAAQQTSRATEIAKSTASEYSAKAQDLIGHAKNRAASPSAPNPANLNPLKDEPERAIKKSDLPSVKKEDFPSAPSSEPISASNHEPYVAPSTAAHTEPIVETTPIPDTAATIPENSAPEVARAEEVDGIKPEALAS